jgi:hypothetical protein
LHALDGRQRRPAFTATGRGKDYSDEKEMQ